MAKKPKEKTSSDDEQKGNPPSIDPALRAELRDKIEAAVVAHERVFEDFVGGLITCTPERTPMQLHELRKAACALADNPETPLNELEIVLAELNEITFNDPRKDNAGA